MIFDAIVLAGGRGSRLGGVSKALLEFEGGTLVGLALDAALDTRRRVIVGDRAALADALGDRVVLFAREEPPFAGPAAAIAAGLDALDAAAPTLTAATLPADFVLVLACDMPRVSGAVRALLAAAEVAAPIAITAAVIDASRHGGAPATDTATDAATDTATDAATHADTAAATHADTAAGRHSAAADGFVARSPDARLQPLAALYCTGSLRRAVDRHRAAGDLDNLSVRALLAGILTSPVDVPAGSTDDIDTVDDAERSGIRLP